MSQSDKRDKPCLHCGTPFQPRDAENSFCCAGCRYVYGLIHQKGLDRYYELRQENIAPVGSNVFHPTDMVWLEDALQMSSTLPEVRTEWEIQGISCVGCVWLIERVFKEYAGGRSIRVLPNQGLIKMVWEGPTFNALAFAREIESFGYRVGPVSGSPRHPMHSALYKRLGLCAALALNTMLFTLPFYLGMNTDDALAPLLHGVVWALATASFLISGSYFFRRCWTALRLGHIHIDLPISIGLIAAYTGSVWGWLMGESSLIYFDFVAIFSALMLAGRAVQEQAISKNRRRLLTSSTWAQKWRVIREGKAQSVSHQELQANDVVIVRPGQVVPVRGRLLKEAAMIGLDWITGESQPFLARPGSIIPAGAVNVSTQKLHIEASESWEESTLKKLVEITDSPPPIQSGLQTIIKIYLSLVLLIALCGALVWWWQGQGWAQALQVAVSILVVSCPCAIGVALPFIDELAVKAARGFGIFVQNHCVWMRLPSIRTIVFDKTGTLTLETPALKDERVIDRLSADQREVLLRMVASSPHPASRAIREALQKYFPHHRPQPLNGMLEVAGSGLEWCEQDVRWRLGRPSWALKAPYPQQTADCVLSRNGLPLVQFHFVEEIRSDARDEIRQLIRMGYEIFLLSGDQPDNVKRMAALLGLPLEHALGGCSPEEKAAWIRSRPQASCLMVGDGANDSLAFDAAHCRGTPAVDKGLLEQRSEFYLLGKNIQGIRKLLLLEKSRATLVRRVLTFTITYNLVAIGVCLFGWMNPLVAAIIMPVSSIVSLGLCRLPVTGIHSKTYAH